MPEFVNQEPAQPQPQAPEVPPTQAPEVPDGTAQDATPQVVPDPGLALASNIDFLKDLRQSVSDTFVGQANSNIADLAAVLSPDDAFKPVKVKVTGVFMNIPGSVTQRVPGEEYWESYIMKDAVRLPNESDEDLQARLRADIYQREQDATLYPQSRFLSHASFSLWSQIPAVKDFERRVQVEQPEILIESELTAAAASLVLFPKLPVGKFFEKVRTGATATGLNFRAGMAAGFKGQSTSGFVRGFGAKFGRSRFGQANPTLVAEAEKALLETGALFRADGTVLFPSGISAAKFKKMTDTMRALRDSIDPSVRIQFLKMSGALEKGAHIGGVAVAGATTMGAYSVPPILFGDQQEREHAIETLPESMAAGAVVPFVFMGLHAAGRGIAKGARSIFSGVKPKPSAPRRLLGSGGDVVSDTSPAPPTPGPQSPPLSNTTVVLEPPRFPRYVARAEEFNPQFQGLTKQVENLIRFTKDPKAADNILTHFQTLRSLPAPWAMGDLDPAAAQLHAQTVSAGLKVIRDLGAADSKPLTALFGFNPMETIALGDMGLPYLHTMRWGQGVITEASRLGVNLEEALASAPPITADPSAIAMRVQALATAVQAKDPTAAVGPPQELLDIQPDLRGNVPPVEFQSPQALPDEELSITDAPSPLALQNDTEMAAFRMRKILAKLSANQEVPLGTLTTQSPDALLSTEQAQVPIYLDNEGRIMATIGHPTKMGGTVDVEVTKGFPRGFPLPAPARFTPNAVAPAVMTLDPKTELLTIDQEATERRLPQQQKYARDHIDAARQGVTNPLDNPMSFIEALQTSPPQRLESIEGALRNLDTIAHKWQSASSRIPRQAVLEAMPGASQQAIDAEHSRLIQEHAMVKAMMEIQKVELLERGRQALIDKDRNQPSLAEVSDAELEMIVGRGTGDPPERRARARPDGPSKRKMDILRKRFEQEVGPAREDEPGLFSQWVNDATRPDLLEGLDEVRELGRIEHKLRKAGENRPLEKLTPEQYTALKERISQEQVAEQDAIAKSDMRTLALAHIATGDGWSARPVYKEWFASLTDEERFQAMQTHIMSGQLGKKGKPAAIEANLQALRPTKWRVTGYPKYFGNWKPTQEQMKDLQAGWEIRRTKWNKGKVLGKKLSNWDGKSEGLLDHDELESVPIETLDEWFVEDPQRADAFVRNYLRQVEEGPEELSQKIDKFSEYNEAIDGLLGDRQAMGPHPKDKRGRPGDGILKTLAVAKVATQPVRMVSHILDRPWGTLGGRLTKPGQMLSDSVASGEAKDAAFEILNRADVATKNLIENNFNDFRLLSEAADRSQELDRAIYNALYLRIPVSRLKSYNVKIRHKEHTIDLKEWVPKLRERMGELREQLTVGTLEALKLQSFSSQSEYSHLEAHIHERQLAEAQQFNENIETWEDIPEGWRSDIDKDLRKANTSFGETGVRVPLGDYGGIDSLMPHDLGQMNYNQLITRRDAASVASARLIGETKALKSERFASLDDVGAVYELSKPHMRELLADEYSDYSRRTDRKNREWILNTEMKEGELPNQSWIGSWFLTVPAIARASIKEPARLKALRKIPGLPASQQKYMRNWIRVLDGAANPLETMMNNAIASTLQNQPGVIDEIFKAILNKTKDPDTDIPAMLKRIADKQMATRSAATLVTQNAVGLTYLALMGPLTIALLNATELGFILHEIAKDPKTMHRTPGWLLKAAGKTLRDVGKTAMSWPRVLGGGSRYLTEAHHQGVLEVMFEALEQQEEYTGETLLEGGVSNAMRKLQKLWFPLIKATEFGLRAFTYYYLKEREAHNLRSAVGRLLPGNREARLEAYRNMPASQQTFFMEKDGSWVLDESQIEKEAAYWAGVLTNDLHGAYTRRDSSPYLRGIPISLWTPFKKWQLGKATLLGTTIRGGINAKISGVLNKTGGELPLTDEMRADMGMQPPIPPPPIIPGSPYNIGPDDEDWEAFRSFNAPPAEWGSAHQVSPEAASIWSKAALIGGIPSLALVYWIGKLVEDKISKRAGPIGKIATWARLNPYDFSRFPELSALFWWKSMSDYINLSVKAMAVGLTVREAETLDKAKDGLTWAIPMIGYVMKQLHYEQMAENRELGVPYKWNRSWMPEPGPSSPIFWADEERRATGVKPFGLGFLPENLVGQAIESIQNPQILAPQHPSSEGEQ